MKRILFICAVCMFSLDGFGAIKLAMHLEYGEKKVAPGVTINSGETATIIQDDLKIQVKADQLDGNRASLSFKVFEVKAGIEKLLAGPSVSTVFGNPAAITQGVDGHAEALKLEVTPFLVP